MREQSDKIFPAFPHPCHTVSRFMIYSSGTSLRWVHCAIEWMGQLYSSVLPLNWKSIWGLTVHVHMWFKAACLKPGYALLEERKQGKHETQRWQRGAQLAAWKMVNDRNWTVVKADRGGNDDMGSSPTCTDRLSGQQTNHSLRRQPLAGCHWADNRHTQTRRCTLSHTHTQIRELWLN